MSNLFIIRKKAKLIQMLMEIIKLNLKMIHLVKIMNIKFLMGMSSQMKSLMRERTLRMNRILKIL